MQTVLNIRSTYGIPLCLSGVTRHHRLSLSKQFADHDRRREEMKKLRSENRILIPAGEINGEIIETEIVLLRSPDLVIFNLDDDNHTACIAKAA